MLICSFQKKIFQCEQSAFERNKFWKHISQFRTCSILQNFAEEILLMERFDWSVGHCLQTSNEAKRQLRRPYSIGVGFRKLFPVWKVLTFERKI